MDEYLYLWPIYGSSLPVLADPHPQLTAKLEPRNNLAVLAPQPHLAQRALFTALTVRARSAYDGLLSGAAAAPHDGWLVIDVPLPNRIDPQQLLHRMIRRLYFTAVLHGMAEVLAFRETVQALRLAFWQTRGSVSHSHDSEHVDKKGAELGLTLKLNPELTGKLTAGDEVKVVEKLSAALTRLDLFEAEDELLYDLRILQRLELFADQNARTLGEGNALQRWEKIRSWFKQAYSQFRQDRPIRLRPAFVFEANSVLTVLELTRFFSQAAGLARAHTAQVLVLGGAALGAALLADRELGHPVFREAFNSFVVSGNLASVPGPQMALLEGLTKAFPADWGPETRAIATRMFESLQASGKS